MSIRDLAQLQLKKHGLDRYPTPVLQFAKLIEEVGELAKELHKSGFHLAEFAQTRTLTPDLRTKIIDEMSDVALALWNLAEKYGVDLETAIEIKVRNDARKFTKDDHQ